MTNSIPPPFSFLEGTIFKMFPPSEPFSNINEADGRSVVVKGQLQHDL